MSRNKTTSVEVQERDAKTPKVILRKPGGARENQGWVGEVIRADGTRGFVPEMFKEVWTDEELAMTKVGNLVKAIADATNFAAKNGYRCSLIIKTHGIDCLQQWDAYVKAVEARKDARKALDGTADERRGKWEEIKGPFNSRVRIELLKMELLTEKILAGEPKKALN